MPGKQEARFEATLVTLRSRPDFTCLSLALCQRPCRDHLRLLVGMPLDGIEKVLLVTTAENVTVLVHHPACGPLVPSLQRFRDGVVDIVV